MLIDWLITLPTWGIMFWFFGGAVLYAIGTGLSHQTGRKLFLVVAFIGVITSWSYVDMLIASKGLQDDPLVSLLSIILPIMLIIIMVQYGFTPSNQPE